VLDELLDREQPDTIPKTVDEIVKHRSAHLGSYQDEALAQKYRDAVKRMMDAEQACMSGHCELAEAVAENYARVLAYKDEYEVARLYSSPAFRSTIAAEFEGDIRLQFNLAPPLLSRTDTLTGRPAKREFGPWVLPVFGLLARLRGLRGTWLDPFGYTAERRQERQLIATYEDWMEQVISNLDEDNHAAAVELLGLPGTMRGFGPVKVAAVDVAMDRAEGLRTQLLA